jgi:hypothetical protein
MSSFTIWALRVTGRQGVSVRFFMNKNHAVFIANLLDAVSEVEAEVIPIPFQTPPSEPG